MASLEARHLVSYSHSSGGDPEQRPRAAIRVSKNLVSLGMEQFWSRDVTACLVRGADVSVVFASVYCDIKENQPLKITLKVWLNIARRNPSRLSWALIPTPTRLTGVPLKTEGDRNLRIL